MKRVKNAVKIPAVKGTLKSEDIFLKIEAEDTRKSVHTNTYNPLTTSFSDYNDCLWNIYIYIKCTIFLNIFLSMQNKDTFNP